MTALVILLTVCFAAGAAAESERGDLSGRFDDESTLTYNDTAYRARSRMTSMLVFCVTGEEQEPGLAAAVVIDDALKTIQAVQIDMRTLLAGKDGEEDLTLGERFANESEDLFEEDEQDPMTKAATALLDALNERMPSPLLQHYFVLNIDGLEQFDGKTLDDYENDNLAARMKARLKDVMSVADSASSSDMLEMLDKMSGSLWTDMKSGALVKVASTAEKYEILPTIIPEGTLNEDETEIVPDENACYEMMVKVFYEEDPWQAE